MHWKDDRMMWEHWWTWDPSYIHYAIDLLIDTDNRRRYIKWCRKRG